MNLKHAVWYTLKEVLGYRPLLLKGTIPYHLVYKVRKASLSQGVTRSVCLAWRESHPSKLCSWPLRRKGRSPHLKGTSQKPQTHWGSWWFVFY